MRHSCKSSTSFGFALFIRSLPPCSYPMQLLDELPIYWLMLSCSHALFYRTTKETKSHPGSSQQGGAALALLGSGITVILCKTDRSLAVHNWARGLMSTTFTGRKTLKCLCFVCPFFASSFSHVCISSLLPFRSFVLNPAAFIYIFYSASLASHETAEQLKTTNNATAAINAIRLYDWAFGSFVLAIVCWLLDNFCCPLLQNLPFLPYPQLHALGWHIGTAVGLHLMFISILLHSQVLRGNKAEMAWGCCGAVPFVRSVKRSC